MYLHFPPAPPPESRVCKLAEIILITAASLADRLDPCRIVRHCGIMSNTCSAVSFLIYFLNAGLLCSQWAGDSVISPLHDKTPLSGKL